MIACYSGDEFVALLPGADNKGVQMMAEKMYAGTAR